MYSCGSIATPVSWINSHTCFVALPAASIEPVPTSKICARCGACRRQYIRIAALVDRLDLDGVLALVERINQMVHLFAERRGHCVPPDDLCLLGGAAARRSGAKGGNAGTQRATVHNSSPQL